MSGLRDFHGRVAVVTGAAHGIGLALARRAAQEGMKVVLADRDAEALARAQAELEGRGAAAVAVPTDVARAADVDRLASEALRAFGAVHVLCNNAGVTAVGRTWEFSAADWDWVLGVNLWGVIHGVRAFVPILLRQGVEGWVLNTASLAGLTSEPGLAPYRVSKHAVVALSETLHHDLRKVGASIGVSVICPSFVRTSLSERVRTPPTLSPELAATLRAAAGTSLEAGIDPAIVAAAAFDAMREQRFYVITHPQGMEQVRARLGDLLEQRNPRAPGVPAARGGPR
jgi:NAD(P)-dependent dehydrogenase (short-subunit alcohol dehydrogenase family)